MINQKNENALQHWLFIRLTALSLIPLGICFVVSLIQLPFGGYKAVCAWLGESVTAILMMIFVLATLYHAAAGMKEVYIDYIHSPRLLRVISYITYALAVILAIIAVSSIFSIWYTPLK